MTTSKVLLQAGLGEYLRNSLSCNFRLACNVPSRIERDFHHEKTNKQTNKQLEKRSCFPYFAWSQQTFIIPLLAELTLGSEQSKTFHGEWMVLLTQTQRCGNIWANPSCLLQGCFTEKAAAALQGLCGKRFFFFFFYFCTEGLSPMPGSQRNSRHTINKWQQWSLLKAQPQPGCGASASTLSHGRPEDNVGWVKWLLRDLQSGLCLKRESSFMSALGK